MNNLYFMQASAADDEPYPLRCYRHLTLRMLRHYRGAATQMGHLPSLLGRCFFRAKVTSFTVHTFEDGVNFVLDMERAMEVLNQGERELIAQTIFERRGFTEVGRILRCTSRNIHYRFENTLDHFTEVLLERGLLTPSMIAVRERKTRDVPSGPDLRFRAARMQRNQPQPASNVISIDACQARPTRVFAATA
jgi:hypothetical protein